MASLKEVKTRIASVNNTRKITSAMKMVASSKLHKAQQAIGSMSPYKLQLERIMSTFATHLDEEFATPYSIVKEVKRVALVIYTSNSSLCGGFNANAIKLLRKKSEEYKRQGIEISHVYAIGKKGYDAVRKLGYGNCKDLSTMLEKPAYAQAAQLSEELMELYKSGATDRVELIYHHFKSAGSQILTQENFLPISLNDNVPTTSTTGDYQTNYIIEPTVEDIIANLIPKTLHLKIYTAVLDSLASEHGARVIAMQVATDNADDLLRELTLTYNKTRQQAITAELLDIVGGSLQ